MKANLLNRIFLMGASVFVGLAISSQANAARKFKGEFQVPGAISVEVPGKPAVEMKSGEATLSVSESLAVVGKDVKLETQSGAFEIAVPETQFEKNKFDFSFRAPKVTVHGTTEQKFIGEREEVRSKRCTFAGVCYSCMMMPDFKMKCGEKKSKSCSGNQDSRFKVTTTETIYKLFVTGADPRVRGEFTSEPDVTEKAEVLEILEPCR